MNLIKDMWSNSDIIEFQKYLLSIGKFSNEEWTKNILRTKLPVLCFTTPKIKIIVDEIKKGNFISFLDHMIWEYYENTAINGFLITKIKDFDLIKKYLDIYSSKADNWATCDLLSFKIKGNEDKFYNLILEYIKSDHPFQRRIGIRILFKFINDDYIDRIFSILDSFFDEDHYYVNMINAWLLSECYVKQRDKTLEYIKHNNLNKFTINMGIQKCRDSRRVSDEDKEILLQYKKS